MKSYIAKTLLILLFPILSQAHGNLVSNFGDTIPNISSIEVIRNSFFNVADSTNLCNPYVKDVERILAQTTYPMPDPEDDRAVYWLHGLNGNKGSWSWASSQFSSDNGSEQADGVVPRKIVNASHISYGDLQNVKLISAASNLRTEFGNAFPNSSSLPNRDRTRSIGIGHSQGGLILRALDYHYRNTPQGDGLPDFGGLVTFVTSNQGAHIVSKDEEVIDFAKRFSAGVAEGKIEALDDNVPGWLQFFGLNLNGEEVTGFLTDSLFAWLGGPITSSQLPPIAQSFAPGSSSLADINSHETTMEEVLAVASERAVVVETSATYIDENNNEVTVPDFKVPLSWATLEFLIRPPNANTEPFEAHLREKDLAVSMHELRLQYLQNQLMEERYEREANKFANKNWAAASAFGACCGLFPNPICCSKLAYYMARAIDAEGDATDAKENARAYERGVEAFDRFDVEYRVAFGLRTFGDSHYELRTFCDCEDLEGVVVEEGPFNLGFNCDQIGEVDYTCESRNAQVLVQDWIDHPSDGLVRLSSQREIPQFTEEAVEISINNTDNPRIGSTHMAIRNDENGKQVLIEIFEGEHGEFFETGERD
jgi:hypothetical protein